MLAWAPAGISAGGGERDTIATVNFVGKNLMNAKQSMKNLKHGYFSERFQKDKFLSLALCIISIISPGL
jgi:hypothetical protein